MIYIVRFFVGKLLGNIAAWLSRIFSDGSGEQIQGRIIDLICPNALGIEAQKRRVIVVSSTNGKTTTTRLIANALRQVDETVISNALGANQRAGIISALVNSKPNTSATKQIAILEVDERSLPGMFSELDPELLIFGNLSRDQLDRFGEVSSISKSWKAMLINSHAQIIANGCDPHIVFAVKDLSENQIEFADIKSQWHSDAHSCPVCGDLLEWDNQSHFESKTCGFATPIELQEMDEKTTKLITDSVKLPGSWNQSNAFLAYLACKHLGLNEDQIAIGFENVREVAGRNAIFRLDEQRTIQLFLAKNPAGWNETLSYISNNPGDATIFAFNCNIADGKDPSWLYDVDFEDVKLNEFVVFGERATDMIVRLEVAEKAAIETKDIRQALAHTAFAKHTNLVATYTQFLSLSRSLPKISAMGESAT